MKKKMTKILSAILVLVMVMCLVPPVEAEAATAKKPYFSTDISLQYYAEAGKEPNRTTWSFADSEDAAISKITNLKSSNKKVVSVYKSTWGPAIAMEAKKAGKATITFDAKVGTKTYSYKCKVTVTKYESPAKTFKIGNKNYAPSFSKTNSLDLGGTKKCTGKLSIITNKNWKIDSIYLWDQKTGKMKKLKNNKTITLKKNQTIFVSFANKKTGEYINLDLYNYTWY